MCECVCERAVAIPCAAKTRAHQMLTIRVYGVVRAASNKPRSRFPYTRVGNGVCGEARVNNDRWSSDDITKMFHTFKWEDLV